MPASEQDPGEPADAGERDAVLITADVGRQPGDRAQRQPDGRQRRDEKEIVSGGRERVEVLRSDPEHEHDRDHEVAAIDLALERLAGDDQDEQQVDEVIDGGHGQMIDLARAAVVGARVGWRVEPRLNPRVETTSPSPMSHQRLASARGRHPPQRPSTATSAPSQTRRSPAQATSSLAGRSRRSAPAPSGHGAR